MQGGAALGGQVWVHRNKKSVYRSIIDLFSHLSKLFLGGKLGEGRSSAMLNITTIAGRLTDT